MKQIQYIIILAFLALAPNAQPTQAVEPRTHSAEAAASAGASLTMVSVTGPTKAFLNQVVSITYRVENQGDADSGPYQVALFLSRDNIIDPTTDILLKKANFPNGLLPGQIRKATKKVSIPSAGVLGKYFYGALVVNSSKVSGQKVTVVRYQSGLDIVTDHKTGLIWQKADDIQERDWSNADLYCQGLSLGGFDDWRLPRIDELRTTADYSRSWPALNPAFVANRQFYWSSSTAALDPLRAWSIYVPDGSVRAQFMTSAYASRCVRGGPFWPFDPSDRLVKLSQQMAKDNSTKLIWQRNDDGVDRLWQDAIVYCGSLTLGGKTDWRLPTIEELQTIIDYTAYNPALSTEVFNGASDLYWSGTPSDIDPEYAWGAFFNLGFVGTNYEGINNFTRCVRGGPY